MEIYQIALLRHPAKEVRMAARRGKKAEASQRAVELHARLTEIRDKMEKDTGIKLSNNQWCDKAGVSRSFFTNLNDGSEPSVGNLRAVLRVIGLSLPEFFLEEAGGRLIPKPKPQELVEALEDALAMKLPRNREQRAGVLAGAVGRLVGIQNMPQATSAKQTTRKQDGRG